MTEQIARQAITCSRAIAILERPAGAGPPLADADGADISSGLCEFEHDAGVLDRESADMRRIFFTVIRPQVTLKRMRVETCRAFEQGHVLIAIQPCVMHGPDAATVASSASGDSSSLESAVVVTRMGQAHTLQAWEVQGPTKFHEGTFYEDSCRNRLLSAFVHSAPAGGLCMADLDVPQQTALQELLSEGLVQSENCRYKLSAAGLSRLQYSWDVGSPSKVCVLRGADIALADRTGYELVEMLSAQGFVWRRCPRDKAKRIALLPYVPGRDAVRVWYTLSHVLCLPYMRSLLEAEDQPLAPCDTPRTVGRMHHP